MSEEADKEDRTESPSDKRLREAREKGDLPRSRDLSTAVVVLSGVTTLIASRDQMSVHAANIMHVGLRYGRDDLFAANGMSRALMSAALEGLKLLGPVFSVTMVAAIAAPALMGGLNFSGQALVPKFDRLDPIKGFSRLVSMNGLVELGKSILKLILIGGALVWFLLRTVREMYTAGTGPVNNGIAQAFGIFGHASLVFGCALGAIALVDAPWQKFSFTKKMKMTKQEVKDEHKESEGSPELKSKIRQMQHQMARKRMMEDVPTADVIVTNPTHFAVALKYDEENDGRAARRRERRGRYCPANQGCSRRGESSCGGSASVGTSLVSHDGNRTRNPLGPVHRGGPDPGLRVPPEAGDRRWRPPARSAQAGYRSGFAWPLPHG